MKSQYYKAIGHQSAGSGLTLSGLGSRPLSDKTKETLLFMYNDAEVSTSSAAAHSNAKINSIIDIRVPKNDAERLQLGKKKNLMDDDDVNCVHNLSHYYDVCP